MPYRRTERVERRLQAKHAALLASARVLAATEGLNAIQIVPVAERSGLATGTVYRYFPSKVALVRAFIASVTEGELAAIRQGVEAAPGPLSALANALVILAWRIARQPRLARALLAEPVEPALEAERSAFRNALIAELARLLTAAGAGLTSPPMASDLAAGAILGAFLEGLAGASVQASGQDAGAADQAAREVAVFALRGVGMADARARGLVAQAPLPAAAPVHPG